MAFKKRNQRKYRKNTPKDTQGVFKKTLIGIFCVNIFATSMAAYVVDGGDATATVGMTTALQTMLQAVTDNYSKLTVYFNAQMQAMDAAVSSATQLENENIVSAYKVLTKQNSVTANLVAENAVNNAQTEAASILAEKKKQNAIDIQENFGIPAQGYKVCTVLAERTQVADVSSENREAVSSLTTDTVYATPGAYGSPYSVQTTMNRNHTANYCTAAQVSSGFCSTVGAKAGWDIQTSTLFTPTIEGTDVYDAQNALINNMIGLPDIAVPKTMSGTPNASNYLIAKQNKDAIISPAIYSLKSIQAEFAGIATTDSGTKLSPIQAVDDQVKRYLGSGDEYTAWNKVLISASESGVMKELLQIQALQLYLKSRQYHQYEREEMLLAGIVAANQKLLDYKDGKQNVSGSLNETERDRSRQDAKNIVNSFSKKMFINGN